MKNPNDGAESGEAVRCSAWLGGILTVYPPTLAQRVAVSALRAECRGEQPTQAYQLATSNPRATPRISAAEWRMETEEMRALLAHCSDSEDNGTLQKSPPSSRWPQVSAQATGLINRVVALASRRLARTAYTLHQWCLDAALRRESALRGAPAIEARTRAAAGCRSSVAESREATRGQYQPMSLAYGGGVALPPNAEVRDRRPSASDLSAPANGGSLD